MGGFDTGMIANVCFLDGSLQLHGWWTRPCWKTQESYCPCTSGSLQSWPFCKGTSRRQWCTQKYRDALWESSQIQTHREKSLEGDPARGAPARAHHSLRECSLGFPPSPQPNPSLSASAPLTFRAEWKRSLFLIPFSTAETGSNFQNELHLK